MGGWHEVQASRCKLWGRPNLTNTNVGDRCWISSSHPPACHPARRLTQHHTPAPYLEHEVDVLLPVHLRKMQYTEREGEAREAVSGRGGGEGGEGKKVWH